MGKKSLLQKARARPDVVAKVVDRARTEGIRSTLDVSRDRLSALTPIGYAAAGVVLEVGDEVEGFGPQVAKSRVAQRACFPNVGSP